MNTEAESRPAPQPEAGEKSNRELFGELYEMYLPKIYRYVSYRVNDVRTAEDVTSAIFEKALDRFLDYRADRGAISTWLFTIARNTVIDYYRSRDRRKTVPLESIGDMRDDNCSVEDEVARREEQARLRRCLERLSGREQEIVSLKFAAENTNREIAKSLRLSESNIGTILYRAVGKLRDCFSRGSHAS